ncbi:cysteine hydrolase family protein [Streptococcus marimammalium]|uniref:cysteine hydrolase family protein n=1 Tax=Streptococcus marimammalium TaxID=269666 RepID=UPI000477A112|nr:isochorismatase family cysteine hydrolase [Streptococcus marimammalium]
MTKALISIDYTYDFVADDGKLTAGKPAQNIEISIVEKTKEAYDNGDFIFFTIDYHTEDDVFHPEMKLFPPHNIKETSGRLLYGKLNDLFEKIKDSNKVFWIDKRHYSAFSGTDLDIRLRERKIHTVVLTGVLTDICVLHTAIDAYNLGYQIEIPKSCVASIDNRNHEWALNHFEHVLGAKIVD